MSYQSRIVDEELAALLSATGAVIVEGPRACGKTSTARQHAHSEVLLDTDPNARTAINVAPEVVLDGLVPRLIDEWQIEPSIWNHIRRAIDDRARPGQFILTGSSVPNDDVTRHTGAGRISRLRMRPMSLFESGHSTGAVSLKALFDGQDPKCKDPGLTVVEVANRIVSGGWPGLLSLDTQKAMRALRGYVDDVSRSDISRVDNIERDPLKVSHLMRALARNIATTASTPTLVADMAGSGQASEDTVYEYLDSLQRLMIVENQPGWQPNIRSRSRVRSQEKRHFVDPSLATAAIRATPERLLGDLEYTGFLFESLVVRDLRIYAQQLDGTVFHYQDNTGLEVDAVVEIPDGRWAAFEVKLGHTRIDQAASNLLKLRDRIKSDLGTTLGVIVASGIGYTRKDGVAVIPIGALGP